MDDQRQASLDGQRSAADWAKDRQELQDRVKALEEQLKSAREVGGLWRVTGCVWCVTLVSLVHMQAASDQHKKVPTEPLTWFKCITAFQR